MNKLWKKFICGIAAIMIFTLILCLVVNSKFVERYYLHSQTRYVRGVGTRLEALSKDGADPESIIRELEETENVLIVYSENLSDSEALSSEMRERFRQKGLGFQRFWLWEQDYRLAVEQGSKLRLYQQDKLKYGILAEYIYTGTGMYAIASIVPDTGETVRIVNQFLTVLNVLSSLTAAALMYILVRHITNPLKEMEEFSRRISSQEYGDSLEVKTNDELQVVAESMNQMSRSICEYQKMLLEKNRQMELLLDNVAHDLKTPVSLIGMYASGIRDGLDDNTFLDTIIRQNSLMAKLIERLLGLSRIEQRDYPDEKTSLDQLLRQQMEEQRIMADHMGLEICADIESGAFITGNPELISTIFSNLLSNSIKYARGGKIYMKLEHTDCSFRFLIENETEDHNLDTGRIWEPFYVGEQSRSHDLSGTGLGLSIVKKIADRSGYVVRCEKMDGKIWFEVIF